MHGCITLGMCHALTPPIKFCEYQVLRHAQVSGVVGKVSSQKAVGTVKLKID